ADRSAAGAGRAASRASCTTPGLWPWTARAASTSSTARTTGCNGSPFSDASEKRSNRQMLLRSVAKRNRSHRMNRAAEYLATHWFGVLLLGIGLGLGGLLLWKRTRE